MRRGGKARKLPRGFASCDADSPFDFARGGLCARTTTGKIKVKGRGQECPRHTDNGYYPISCSRWCCRSSCICSNCRCGP
jgi:hypothetical protein